jgi:hypothetical protein
MWRAPSFLVLFGVGILLLAAWAGLGMWQDFHVWRTGRPVEAELTGKITSKLIMSIVDVDITYRVSGENNDRTSGRMFMSLWEADTDAGIVKVSATDPSLVTFEEAYDMLPFRLPLNLLLGVAGLASLVAARSSRRAGLALRNFATVVDVLTDVVVTENQQTTIVGKLRSSGAATTITLVAGELTPMVAVDDKGGWLVLRSSDAKHVWPLRIDGHPLVLAATQKQALQADIEAAGSTTKIL